MREAISGRQTYKAYQSIYGHISWQCVVQVWGSFIQILVYMNLASWCFGIGSVFSQVPVEQSRAIILVARGGEMGWSLGGTENGTGQLEDGVRAWEMTCFFSQLWELWGAWSQVEHPRHKLQQHRWVWGIRGGRATLWAERTKPGPAVRGRGGQWGFPLHCWGQWLGLWWMRLPLGLLGPPSLFSSLGGSPFPHLFIFICYSVWSWN